MSLPNRVPFVATDWNPRWLLDCRLQTKLSQMQSWWSALKTGLPGAFSNFPPIYIISGHRTEAENARVGGAPDSRHKDCPATAADLRVGPTPGFEGAAGSLEIWQILGGWWKLHGGRWGGDFSTPDPNHFDLG